MTAARTARCPWWRAWIHRRRRRADETSMWTQLRANAAARYPHDDEKAVLLALQGWAVFVQLPGQDHWRCPCSDDDVKRGPA